MPFRDATPMYRKTPYSTGMGMYCGHGKNTALTLRKAAASGTKIWGKIQLFLCRSPKHPQDGKRRMFYLQDGGQEDGNPRQHEDDDSRHSLLPATAREMG